MTINQIRTVLYGLGKALGDLQALLKGGDAIERRLKRRILGKLAGRAIGKAVDGR